MWLVRNKHISTYFQTVSGTFPKPSMKVVETSDRTPSKSLDIDIGGRSGLSYGG